MFACLAVKSRGTFRAPRKIQRSAAVWDVWGRTEVQPDEHRHCLYTSIQTLIYALHWVFVYLLFV